MCSADESGRTVLHEAAAHGHEDNVELLLRHGANARATDEWSQTALHRVAYGSGHIGVAKLLLAHGVDVRRRDNDGRTAADIALERGNTEVLKLLPIH